MEILETVPMLTPALEVVGAHHERYDGSGYPQGLGGEEIPLAARIFGVVDVLDALTHDRPHRPARPLAEALDLVRREAGTHFDPRIVAAALGLPPERWAALLGCPAPAWAGGGRRPGGPLMGRPGREAVWNNSGRPRVVR